MITAKKNMLLCVLSFVLSGGFSNHIMAEQATLPDENIIEFGNAVISTFSGEIVSSAGSSQLPTEEELQFSGNMVARDFTIDNRASASKKTRFGFEFVRALGKSCPDSLLFVFVEDQIVDNKLTGILPLTVSTINRDLVSGFIVAKTAHDINALTDFIPIGIGEAVSGGVQRIYLSGTVNESYSEDEMRRLIVLSAFQLRNNINSIPLLRPLLCSYPFPCERLKLSIFSENSTLDQFSLLSNPSAVRLSLGTIYYEVTDPQGRLTIYKEEPFEEAVRKVEQWGKEQDLPPLRLPPSKLTKIPLPTKMPATRVNCRIPQVIEFDNYFEQHCNKIADAHALKMACTGDFCGSVDGCYYGLSLYGFKSYPLQESKECVQKFFTAYYDSLKTAPEIQKFQKWRQAKEKENFSLIPKFSETPIKVTFWDADFNPQRPPNIAQITFLDGKFSYYQADPVTHELTLVDEESYTAKQ